MKKTFTLILISLFMQTLFSQTFTSANAAQVANNQMKENIKENPLIKDWKTPHETPPFSEIKIEHFLPAFIYAIEQAQLEIDAIVKQKTKPTFQNVIISLENAGQLLSKVSGVFFNLTGSLTSPEMRALAKEISPLTTAHANKIFLNKELFLLVEQVYLQKEKLTNQEDKMLLEKTYKRFLRSGAKLNEEQKEKYRELTVKLSKLALEFGENVLNYTNAYSKHITDVNLLKGVPQSQLDIAQSRAKSKELEGYLFDLSQPSYTAIMTYADDRELRKEIFMEYNARAYKGKYDNSENIRQILQTRSDIAKLLGYKNYVDYVLEERMAEKQENVYKLLDDLAVVAVPAGKKEVAEIQEFAKSLGFTEQLQRWDFSYYAEKLKNKKFDLNEEMLKPYFKLEKVIEGVFNLTANLFELTYKQNDKIQVYHKDVTAYEVYRGAKFMGVLYLDFHPRESKRAGAWMNSYRGQYILNDKDVRPIVTLNMNFTPSTETSPSLLAFSEVNTFLHEFGHALHGLLSECTYSSISGTSVSRDFVELPSQIMENWVTETDFLKTFAYHYQTNELIPQDLIKKLKDTETYLAGYTVSRQLSLGYTDMMWHTIDPSKVDNIVEQELAATEKVNLLPKVPGTCTSTSFSHIFSGGYAVGYYSYKWAEVLEADAFSLFKEKGVFDKQVANSFVKNILSKGGSQKPMELFVAFRGREPKVDALLQKFGF